MQRLLDGYKELPPYACSVSEGFPIASAINYCQRKESGVSELIISYKAVILKKEHSNNLFKIKPEYETTWKKKTERHL